MKLNRAKRPIIRKMIKGLENVNRKPLRIFLEWDTCESLGRFRVREGFDRKRYMPKMRSTALPAICITSWLSFRKSSINESPKPVSRQ